jgi:hypothetical protein
MSEATGSEASGNPGGSQEGAPAPDTSNVSQEGAPTGVALQQEGQPSGHWLDNVQDPATREWAEAKGLRNAPIDAALSSYHNLEKLMGADKAGRTVVLPGDDATPEQRAEFFNKLGRPEAPDKYSVALPEGTTDTTRLDMMREAAFEAGITDAQLAKLAEADQRYIETAIQSQADESVISAADAELQLKKEWGAAYDLKVAGIDVAASKLGFTEDHLNGLRNAMGPVEAMKFVDNLNTKMGDHNFDEGDDTMINHKTPAQAKQELSELTMNKDFMDAWTDRSHPGHAAAVEKKAALARLISGHV